MALGVTIDETPRLMVVSLSGDLDLGSVPRLHDALQKAGLHTVPDVALDLDGLTSIDETALGILRGSVRNLSDSGRRLWFVCNEPNLVDRLRGIGLLDSAEIVRSVHDIASR